MSMAIDPKVFRQTLGKFATGVTVIAVAEGDEVHAMTANAFTSVSLDPPLILVCIDHRARTLPMIRNAGKFAVNVLTAEQENLSRLFARQAVDEEPSFTFDTMDDSAPLLNGALAGMDCTVVQDIEAGDHAVLIAHVDRIVTGEGEPLCFYQGRYAKLAP